MTRHDPDREFEGFPLPDGDEELTAALNGAIDVDQGWQEIIHRACASTLQEGYLGQADPPSEPDLPELLDTAWAAVPCENVLFILGESRLPYGIDALLQDIGSQVKVLQVKVHQGITARRWARSSQDSKVAVLAERLLEQVHRLQQGLTERTLEQEKASEIMASCVGLAVSITEYNESRQLADHARGIRRRLEDLDRLVVRLFDDTDHPCVPARPSP
ncbi:hypothetical protein HUT06_21270 [Actinomadura sp. NAK00032]|uniref:hypothetical protein n=1 Tax=Actinomadura sp. NAK00032 TaxID=2742128 RepID=UPI0015913F87|nr:hypothetical protein [Actinomadura sp. NAK00032]QKW36251.1 hypothetical protein HUT06_21270 [Actinomadura sp. NAK00032]